MAEVTVPVSTFVFVALKLTKTGQYRATDGSMRYIYRITGDANSVAAYIESNPNVVYDRVHAEIPLYFSRQILGDVATLTPNEDGTRWYAEANPGIALMKETMTDMLRASGMLSMFGMGSGRTVPAMMESEEDTTPAAPAAPVSSAKTAAVPAEF